MDVKGLHDSLVIVDGHCDSVMNLVGIDISERSVEKRDLLTRSSIGHIDLPRLIEGGVSGQVFALFTDNARLGEAKAHTWRLLEALEGLFSRSDGLTLATQSGDAERAKKENRVAAFLAIEGGEAIGESLDELRAFYSRGVRLLGLTWNRRNAIARGVGTEGSDGLSDFGRNVIREMERLGMVVDVSHLSDQAFDEALDFVKRPVIASHSNSRAVYDHRRNLTDAQAERIAASGGLIGVTYVGMFIDEDPNKVSLSRLLDHVDHLISVVGAEHVGLGSDFDGFTPSHGVVLEDCASLPKLTAGLVERSYSESDIRNIMGGNWLRVLRDICG